MNSCSDYPQSMPVLLILLTHFTSIKFRRTLMCLTFEIYDLFRQQCAIAHWIEGYALRFYDGGFV